jgi:hypothetical protein
VKPVLAALFIGLSMMRGIGENVGSPAAVDVNEADGFEAIMREGEAGQC